MSDAQNDEKADLISPSAWVCSLRSRPELGSRLTYEPYYYRAMVGLSREQRAGRAKKFVAQSLQLRNDICNEPNWEAVFTDQEVNAWLAEDLVTLFRRPASSRSQRAARPLRARPDHSRLPASPGRRSIGDHGRCSPAGPGGNTIELTLEKIRAGILPVPADNILDRIIEYARSHGVDAEWARKDGYPVVVMRYTPHIEREDVQLEELQIHDHQIRLAGRSDRARGRVSATHSPFRKSASLEVPRAKDPRCTGAGARPRAAKVHLAHQLRPAQLDAHVISSDQTSTRKVPASTLRTSPRSPEICPS